MKLTREEREKLERCRSWVRLSDILDYVDELLEARAEAATVPCGVCEGDGYAPRKEDREGYLDGPCTAPGCVNGRVDARLAACLGIAEEWDDEERRLSSSFAAARLRKSALAKYGPEAKETT